MPYRQYPTGHVLYSDHDNFPVFIMTYLMFFCTYVYVYACYILWFAFIMSIQHIYLLYAIV